jgi:Tfp pilus assembly protein PilF
MGRYLFLPLVAFFAWFHPFPELLAKESLKDEIQTFLQRGVEKGLNLNEPEAVAEIRKAIELDPESPLGYSYLAMAYLFFYETKRKK